DPNNDTGFSSVVKMNPVALVPQVVFDEASAKVFFNPFYPNITRMSKNTLPHSFLSTERLSLSQ
ncbi:MAG TPA: hypothetical protein PK442_05960, partial [Synergistales bacterium]|nr:hypothetical protein [Synergistales bacterium]